MRHSFEELIGRELDRLYRAAVFLSANQKSRAEQLLQAAALRAFREYRSAESTFPRADRWLDEHLARAFMAEAGQQGPSPRSDVLAQWAGNPLDAARATATGALELRQDLDLEDLALAAASLSPEHRVTFWLAVVERRRYSDICEIMNATREVVSEWIREAHRLIARGLSALDSEPRDQRRRRHEM